MLLATALKGMSTHREALTSAESASNPSYISEHTHKLTQYISATDACVAELEEALDVKEAEVFEKHIAEKKTANAAKELVRREFAKERAQIKKINRLISSGWKLVNESQSRVKHLIAEANNQI